MKYGNIEGIDNKISRLIQGTMMMSDKDNESLEAGFKILDAVNSLGCNAFDTGEIYGGGGSEGCLGKWMKERGNRKDMVVLDKGCHPMNGKKRVTPEDLAYGIKVGLERLQTDYIDLYVLHRDNPELPVGPIVEEFNRQFDAGAIKAFGGSNWTVERIEEANEYAAKHNLKPFSVSSPNYSLARQIGSPWGDDCITVSGPENAPARKWYADHKMPILTWSSMARGFFSGRYNRDNFQEMANGPDQSSIHAYCYEENFVRLDRATELAKKKGLSVAQIALAYVLSQPLDIYALVGCYTYEEFEQCAQALDIPLTLEEQKWLNLED
jgi:aryl-alcohol dehydrogenase-like predicted oxidoreductase